MALYLTLDNYFDVSRSRQIGQEMLSTAIFMALELERIRDTDDFTEYFYNIFDSSDTNIEDGSVEQAAQLIVEIRYGVAKGDFAHAVNVLGRKGRAHALRYRNVRGPPPRQLEEGEDQEESGNGAPMDVDLGEHGSANDAHEKKSAHTQQMHTNQTDEDGFTLVTSTKSKCTRWAGHNFNINYFRTGRRATSVFVNTLYTLLNLLKYNFKREWWGVAGNPSPNIAELRMTAMIPPATSVSYSFVLLADALQVGPLTYIR